MAKRKRRSNTGPLLHEAYLCVYDGQVLRGYLVSRGRRGVEAYDTDNYSLGIHPDQQTAANVVVARWLGTAS